MAAMFDPWHLPVLFGTGLVAGFVDSIAGGTGAVGLFALRRARAVVNLCRSCPVV